MFCQWKVPFERTRNKYVVEILQYISVKNEQCVLRTGTNILIPNIRGYFTCSSVMGRKTGCNQQSKSKVHF